MFVSSIIVIVFTFICLIFGNRSKTAYLFFASVLATAAVTVFTALYVVKIGNYIYITNADYNIYRYMSGLPISFFSLGRFYNLSVAMYMASVCLIYKSVCRVKKYRIFGLIMLIIIYICANDPTVAWKIFARASAESVNFIAARYGAIKNIFNLCVISLFFFALEIKMVFKAIETTLTFRKKSIFCIAFVLLLLSVYMFFILFRVSAENLNFGTLDMINFPDQGVYVNSHILTPFTYVFFAAIVMIAMGIVRPFDNINPVERMKSVNSIRLINKNLSSMLHAYKNAFCSIDNITDLLIESRNNGDEKSFNECAGMIKKIAHEQVENIAKVNDVTKQGYLRFKKIDISACVYRAIKKSGAETRLTVRVVNELKTPYVVGDEDYLSEVFYNIIDNAVYAVAEKEYPPGEDRLLEINMYSEENYCVIKLKDNGVGISRTDCKNIFKMFWSTKKNAKNNGIGLYSAYFTIRQHEGYIYVDSRENKYTQFTVFIPQARN